MDFSDPTYRARLVEFTNPTDGKLVGFKNSITTICRLDLNNSPTPEAVKNLLDQNITQVTEIRRLGRRQSIGSRCDKFNAPLPQVSEASSSNQPFNAVNGRGSSDTYSSWHSKLRRGRVEFIAP